MKPKCFYVIFILYILFYVSPFSNAEEALTLEQCTSLALKNNHLYRSSQQEFRASQARVRLAAAFPQPEIAFDWDLQPKLPDFKHSGESYLGINQSLEFPGRRLLRKKIAGKESAVTGCELDLVRLEIIYDVKCSFYELLLNLEIQKYAQENLEMARDFAAKAAEKYQDGAVSKLEMLRAKVEVARAGNLLEVSLNQVKLACAQLNFLLARDRFQTLRIQGELRGPLPELSLPTLLDQAQAFHPGLKKERLAVQKESLSKKQAALSFLPDVALGVSRHRLEGEPTTWDVALSFQVPLFFWQKINGDIAEANANLAAARARLKHQELAIALEVENAYYKASSLKNQVEFFEREVLAEAEQVYQMSMTSCEEGKIGSIELLEARRSLLDLKQSYAEALFNYQEALAQLEKSLGTSMTGSLPAAK